MLPKGMSYGSQVLVHGDTGVGKTVLAGEFLKEGLRCGDTCIYVACDEPPDVMRRHLQGFKVSTRAYEEAERLYFVDAYEEDASKEQYSLAEANTLEAYLAFEKQLLQKIKAEHIRLITDSLSTMLVLFPPEEVLAFHRSRLKHLRKKGILTLDIFVDGVLEEKGVAMMSHLYNIILRMKVGGPSIRPVRWLQIGKLRSGKFFSIPYMFWIDPIFGIMVAPGIGGVDLE
jgi:KaiC/GvpD/RAD55 family RecA-like ATPase